MYWFIKCLKQYNDFSGRARRKEYWSFILLANLFLLILGIIARIIPSIIIALILHILFFIMLFALCIPALAVNIRRIHDLNKSGWIYLTKFIPIIGGVWFFILTILPGTEGQNDYGPDPLEEDEYY